MMKIEKFKDIVPNNAEIAWKINELVDSVNKLYKWTGGFEQTQEPERWKCGRCGRNKFTRKEPHAKDSRDSDELAERLEKKADGMPNFHGYCSDRVLWNFLADEARKWAVKVVEKVAGNEDYADEDALVFLIKARLKESK